MQQLRIKVILIFLMIAVSISSYSQTGTTVIKRESKTKKILPKNLSIGTKLSFGGTLASEETSEGARTASLRLTPSYELPNDYSISLDFSLVQRVDVEQFYNSNLDIALNFPEIELTDSLSFYTAVAGVAPTDHDDYRDLSYRGGAYVDGLLSAKIFEQSFPLTVKYGLTVGRDFHQFRTNYLSLSNIEFYTHHALSIKKKINSFSVGASGLFAAAWDYNKTYKPRFIISQKISYKDKNKVTYALAHSNAGSVLDYDGEVGNIKAFDDYSSKINFSLSYNIK